MTALNAPSHFSILPLDLSRSILLHLPATSVVRLSQVSKFFYWLSNDERIWEMIVRLLGWSRSRNVRRTSFDPISNALSRNFGKTVSRDNLSKKM